MSVMAELAGAPGAGRLRRGRRGGARALATAPAATRPLLQSLAERRLTGEPLAWITGRTAFGDLDRAGPRRGLRPPLAEPGAGPACRGAAPRDGDAPSTCAPVRARSPSPSGGPAIGARRGDRQRRAAPSPAPGQTGSRPTGATCSTPCRRRSAGTTDVVVAVVPYVPSDELRLLPRDTLGFEDASHYDGGRRRHGRAAAGRRATPPASCAPAGRCCSSWAATRPSCSARRWSDLGYVSVRDLVRRGRRPARPGGDARLTSSRGRLNAGRRPAPPTTGPPHASGCRARGTAPAACRGPTRRRRRGRRTAAGRDSWSGSSPP